MSEYDVVVIGGGAAGLSAALVLTRARRTVAVVDAGNPRNAPAAHLHGFLSRDGLPPRELLAAGMREVAGYGGDLVDDTVIDVTRDTDGGSRVGLAGGRVLTSRRLLVTTGLRDELPDVPGLLHRWARDVLHCPYCHGYEVRDRPLGVLAAGPDAVRYAQIVRQWTDDLVYFTPPGVLTADERTGLLARAIGVVEGVVEQIVVEDDRLRGVRLGDGRFVPRDVMFVPPHFVPNDELLTGLGCPVGDDGWVLSDAVGRTGLAGVWVAGNVVDPRAQLITSAGAGSAAALSLNADLVEDDVRRAVLDFEHGRPVGSTSHTH